MGLDATSALELLRSHRMTPSKQIVFLVDVDDTLLENDRISGRPQAAHRTRIRR
jgi:hypothetical protein